ncbi:hypothetical protein [uncultured Microbulbifer sp.]|uniref:hypothetical protein n=1 Tax=uncultured Microbulbifer sp. TaxID=348147 RepID=UPI002639BA6D|nr:hypothetical protein [uncultured Microbulbifer sp.]
MKKLFIAALLAPSTALADFGTQFDSKFGLGLGTQYGGVAGLQYSLSGESDKFYIGAGRADFFESDYPDEYGLTLGWEHALTEKQTFGLALRTSTEDGRGAYYQAGYAGLEEATEKKDGFEYGLFGSYSYYFSGIHQSGFVAGANLGKLYRKDNVRSEFRNGTAVGVHLGYQF